MESSANKYMRQVYGQPKVFLHPGEFFFATAGECIHTLVGSCIAICLWHPRLHVGGMCHFVVPERPRSDRRSGPDGRYGDETLELFRHASARQGTMLSEYQGQIFGGGNLIAGVARLNEDPIGTRNAHMAQQLLRANGIEILVADTGGKRYRRLVFETSNGKVWVCHHFDDGVSMED